MAVSGPLPFFITQSEVKLLYRISTIYFIQVTRLEPNHSKEKQNIVNNKKCKFLYKIIPNHVSYYLLNPSVDHLWTSSLINHWVHAYCHWVHLDEVAWVRSGEVAQQVCYYCLHLNWHIMNLTRMQHLPPRPYHWTYQTYFQNGYSQNWLNLLVNLDLIYLKNK